MIGANAGDEAGEESVGPHEGEEGGEDDGAKGAPNVIITGLMSLVKVVSQKVGRRGYTYTGAK